MIKELIKLANDLDEKGLTKEADYIDWLIKNANDDYHEYIFETQIQAQTELMVEPGTLPGILGMAMNRFVNDFLRKKNPKSVIQHSEPRLEKSYREDSGSIKDSGPITYTFSVVLHADKAGKDIIQSFGPKFEQPAVELVNKLVPFLSNYKDFTGDVGGGKIHTKRYITTKNILATHSMIREIKKETEELK